jgi:hypothetical protein
LQADNKTGLIVVGAGMHTASALVDECLMAKGLRHDNDDEQHPCGGV